MRYLLVVGFNCDIYRHEPKARIFVDGKLLDEWLIPSMEDLGLIGKKSFFLNKHPVEPFDYNKLKNLEIKNFPNLRFYEIEMDNKKDQIELRIDIENNDSNYSNGFISKSTMIKLHVFYFFPLCKSFLSKLQKMSDKNLNLENYKWRWCTRNRIFDLRYNTIWQSNDKKVFKKICNTHGFLHPIGGSGNFQIIVSKKYGIFLQKLKKSCRFYFIKVFVDYFYYKYDQYVNQGNNN